MYNANSMTAVARDARIPLGPEEARRAVAERELWYHTMDLGHEIVTNGWFDLRPIVDRLPWPDLNGRRCLDVGPWDGFLSFEMERRGAAEVVALDIGSHEEWDWPAVARHRGPEAMRQMAGVEVGAGFRTAREILGSRVERVESNVYSLSPEEFGMFDFIVCGSLMLHLRDPVAALEAIRSVCAGTFMSAEEVRVGLTIRARRRPLAEFRAGERCQWWIPNVAGHRRMVGSAGFEIQQAIRPYVIPFGPGHPNRKGSWRRMTAEDALMRTISRRRGMAHSALLAKPRF
jgi:tRNA (mo5U34)-methyltransferase